MPSTHSIHSVWRANDRDFAKYLIIQSHRDMLMRARLAECRARAERRGQAAEWSARACALFFYAILIIVVGATFWRAP